MSAKILASPDERVKLLRAGLTGKQIETVKQVINMKCPKCKKHELEISKADVSLSRKGIRIWLACENNICSHYRLLELQLQDILSTGK